MLALDFNISFEIGYVINLFCDIVRPLVLTLYDGYAVFGIVGSVWF